MVCRAPAFFCNFFDGSCLWDDGRNLGLGLTVAVNVSLFGV